jgi:hypothetical protein
MNRSSEGSEIKQDSCREFFNNLRDCLSNHKQNVNRNLNNNKYSGEVSDGN